MAQRLYEKGLPVVGVPKTIDNDVGGTVATFGFDTAVATATDALDRLHSTAESHERVMVVEVMGRYAGWIALNAGISGSADVILIPEIPFDIEKVCEKIRERDARGRRFSVVVVAEGAAPKGGTRVIRAEAAKGGAMERLGGVAERVAGAIGEITGKETRALTLGHLQRGGSPTTFDRLLALRFGAAAVRCVAAGEFGVMVALAPPTVRSVPLQEALAKPKLVPLDADSILTAREVGICLGD
jgi:6-phosphofructokinase 1